MKLLEQNLPLDDVYKSKDVNAAPIRVIQVIYNAGVKMVNIQILNILFFIIIETKWFPLIIFYCYYKYKFELIVKIKI